MTFFYDLNKRLSQLSAKQDAKQLTESAAIAEKADYSAKKAAAGQDIGKPGKMFSKIAKSAGKEYGSKAAGERVAGAVLNKLRAKESVEESDMDESALQAYIGDKKYGKTGMDALRKAGREGASKDKMSQIRDRYNKMDEADMEEGNRFTGNLIKARAAGLKKADLDGDGDMEAVREASKPDYIDLDKDGNRKETMKKAAADKKKSRSTGTAFDPEVAKTMTSTDKHPRYDVKDTGYSTRYTRKIQDEPKDDTEVDTGPKKKGRPKGPAKGPERVTAKSYKYKAGRPSKTKEDLDTDGVMMNRPSNMSSESINPADRGEYDREGDMALNQLHQMSDAAKELHGILDAEENLPEWVQSKITKALDYLDTARDYMKAKKKQYTSRGEEAGEPVAEKAVSKKQQKFMGMVHAAQKGERSASGAVAKVAKSMGKKDAEDFAKTKHKGLPEKVKEADAEAPKEKKAKGGYNFGAGVYESINSQVEGIITEGMNVSVNMSTGQNGEPTKNITISADGADADRLAELLKMAGLGGQESACNTCGSTPCGCESLDENSPDWPTNTETSDDAMQYSGGLNGPKSTGQSTVPVLASQLRRQVSMEENVELQRDLFRLYNNYKAQ
jgi:hypothetical protein